MASSKREHVISANLEKVVADEGHLVLIRNAVKRVHRITIDGTELLYLHLTRCLEQDLPIPTVDAAFIKMVFMEVSNGDENKRRRVDTSPNICQTFGGLTGPSSIRCSWLRQSR